MIIDKCNCGRNARYYHQDGRMSCNKYLICQTYDELSSTLKETNSDLWLLIKAANDLLVFKENSDKYTEAEKVVHLITSKFKPT